MKAKPIAAIVLLVTMIVGSLSPTAANGSPEVPPVGLRLIHASESEAVLELRVPDFTVEHLTLAGEQYQRLAIPGMGSTILPGAPQVPTTGILIGVAALDHLQLEILTEDYEVLKGFQLVPAPEMSVAAATLDEPAAGVLTERVAPNLDNYGANQFYPGPVVEVGDTGYMRDQAVAQLRFYPVQYNPVRGEVRVYQRLVVRLSWSLPAETGPDKDRSSQPAYEALLNASLANYANLARPTHNPRTGEVVGDLNLLPAASEVVSPALKLGVMDDGMYRLTYTDVVASGFAVGGVDARTFKISNRGQEIPILVTGGVITSFDPGDEILFYGTAITDDIYTEKNVYWLTAGGVNGARIITQTSTGGGPVPISFPETLHAEEDTIYWQTMPNGLGQDHWFWNDIISPNTQGYPVSRTFTFQLRNIVTDTIPATLTVRLKGATNVAANPDHQTRFWINGVAIGSPTWDGFAVADHVVTFSHALLVSGTNTLRVEALNTGAVVDQVYVNWFEVDYGGRYAASSNQLYFHPPAAGQYTFSVSGFNSDQVYVFDVTNPIDVGQIVSLTVQPESGKHKVEFEDLAQANSTYLALTPARFMTPSSIELDSPSNWATTGHLADYIMITHSQFYTATLELAQHRETQGLQVEVVKVEDLYDEFNWGIFNPQAIRDFLAYAYANWTSPAPIYVLLVGGASYDYREKLTGLDRVNYVPTQMIETFLLGQTASDNWFVAFVGNDLLPDMFIGRLTAESAAEVNDMIDKVIAYEQNPPDDSWNTRALFVAGVEPSFALASDNVLTTLYPFLQVDKVYEGEYSGGADPTADISAAINGGRTFVNYMGHGDPKSWNGQLYTPEDIAALTNVLRFPVVTIGNCLNGFFVGKTKPSMAEEFLKRGDRGAVAVWAPTGLGFTSGHQSLLEEFYQTIFYHGVHDLGAATTAAKVNLYAQSGFWGELIETYVLFGDPVTSVAVPDLDFVYVPQLMNGN